MHIRKARVEDATALVEAEKEIAKTPGRLVSRPEELQLASFQDKIRSLNANDCALYVVLEENGELVGHALLDQYKLIALAHVVTLTLAIHEGHQGKGHGRLLMEHLIAWAKAQPTIEKIELQVRSRNTRAVKLYESLGFQEEGRKLKRLKYGPNDYQDDIYMGLWVG
jgi:ribosomal protein S18 acetylase RimI-like enzyme